MVVFIIVFIEIIDVTVFPCCSTPKKSGLRFCAIASTKLRNDARKIQVKLKKMKKGRYFFIEWLDYRREHNENQRQDGDEEAL